MRWATSARCLLPLAAIVGLRCGEEQPMEPVVPSEPQVATVHVTPDAGVASAFGATVQFSAVARTADGDVVNGKTFVWTSGDSTIAVVDGTGQVTAVANGSTVVQATTDSVAGQADFRVDQQVTSVSVTADQDTIRALGDTLLLAASAADSLGNPVVDEPVIWSSSDTALVAISDSGVATGVSVGLVRIAASIGGVAAWKVIAVVQEVRGVVVTAATDTLRAFGETTTLVAAATDGNGSNVPNVVFSWASSTPSVAMIDSVGTVTALDNGATTITASAEGLMGIKTVHVSQVVTNVLVTGGADTLRALGDTSTFTAEAFDSLGSNVLNRPIQWMSNDSTVMQVDTAGVVVATGNGTATLRALVDSVEGTRPVAVAQRATSLSLVVTPAGAEAGEAFLTQPVVEVWDARGNLVGLDSATIVTATIDSGGGVLVGVVVDTVAGGVAAFGDLGIGGTVGLRTLTFNAPGLDSTRSGAVAVTAGPASDIAEAGGNGQSGPADTVLPVALAVVVSDSFGNPVPDVEVGWAVLAGGIVSPDTSLTDSLGVATALYTLGNVSGVDSVEASVGGLSGSPVTFTAVVGPNASISGTITLSSLPLAASFSPTIAARPASRAPLSAGVTVPRRTGELIVTWNSRQMAAPAAGSAAYGGLSTSTRVATALRTQVAGHGPAVQLEGVSPALLATRVSVADGVDADSVMAALSRDPRVSRVEWNPLIVRTDRAAVHSTADVIPNDPLYAWQAWHYQMVGLPQTWGLTTGSAGVTVAVVDDGIRFDHPDIAGNLTADGYDFVSTGPVPLCAGGSIDRASDGDGYDPDPTNPIDVIISAPFCVSGTRTSGNHGLHVAGTIGAVGDNGVGVSGANWTAAIRPVRVCGLDGCAHYDIAQGILYASGLPADDGAGGFVMPSTRADIINMSLGGPSGSTVMANAIAAADAAGVLIIAAAGNTASSVPQYPASYPEVVSVSALGPDGQLASYSSFGSLVELSAPGGDIADGGATFGVMSTAWNYVAGLPIYDASIWNGTSMAAPHVSGVAALVLASDPSLTAAALRARLTSFAVDAGAPGRDASYGFGIVNARNSVTATTHPVRETHVALYDATTGERVATTAAGVGGMYTFNALSDGDYFVYAGEDADADGEIGIPARRWGAFGGSGTPDTIVVSGAGSHAGSFTMGFPIEAENNGSMVTANRLVLDGYLAGTISNPSTDFDYYEFVAPTTALYTFETGPGGGACGFALDEDTVLSLYDAAGTLLASNDDIDPATSNFCSEIMITLGPGKYFVRVSGKRAGQYTVRGH